MFRVVDLWQERDIDFLVSSKNSSPPILFKNFIREVKREMGKVRWEKQNAKNMSAAFDHFNDLWPFESSVSSDVFRSSEVFSLNN
jgi:hypothetical protein